MKYSTFSTKNICLIWRFVAYGDYRSDIMQEIFVYNLQINPRRGICIAENNIPPGGFHR